MYVCMYVRMYVCMFVEHSAFLTSGDRAWAPSRSAVRSARVNGAQVSPLPLSLAPNSTGDNGQQTVKSRAAGLTEPTEQRQRSHFSHTLTLPSVIKRAHIHNKLIHGCNYTEKWLLIKEF